ncbi:MAG TPA: serine/threonine-protein kinase [Ktedonobacteraceae bacterium]|nr:serine/threonine-protein kinase [Ktedonobacteraceae bacterium]
MFPQQAPDPIELLPHMLFRDRYFIIGKVGAGGFGSVYKATDTQSGDRLVAIKEVRLPGLHPQAVIEATNAFQREVSLLSQLRHSNLPRLYEHFQSPGYWYLVMDFIVGETLEEYQGKAPNKRPLLSEVFNIGIQLCTVLDYLHSQQPPIVFRDLKPANIMRTPTGQIYLIDFGIARYFKPGQAKDTIALGSPGYAAPEQYGKAQTTPRADIYSLGVVLHQLLTTKDPSEAPFRFTPLRPNNPYNHSEPGSLTTSMVDVLVHKLETLITSMLDMDVNKRPPDVARVKQELHFMSELWSDIHKSFWRPKLGYTSQVRK